MTSERIAQINQLIAENPDWHRTKLSQELCRIWDWRGENGQIKDVSCRDVLRALDAAGKIKLPPQRSRPRSQGSPDRVELLLHATEPIEGSLRDLLPLTIEVVTDHYSSMEFKSFIAQYHYLGYDRYIGENIKYFVQDRQKRRLACLMFGSAAWSCAPRDTFIGWDKEQRKVRLKYMTNNSRFLIVPWVRVPHLASHILSLICKRISADWVAKYGHPLFLLETFVESGRFRGTCYQAANWVHVGRTTGLGRNKSTAGMLPIKEIYLYPLHKRFREELGRPIERRET